MSRTPLDSLFYGVIVGLWPASVLLLSLMMRLKQADGGEGSIGILVVGVVWPFFVFLARPLSTIRDLDPRNIGPTALISLIVFLMASLLSAFVSSNPIYSFSFALLSFIAILFAIALNQRCGHEGLSIGMRVYAVIGCGTLVWLALRDYAPGVRLGQYNGLLNPNSTALIAMSVALCAAAFKVTVIRYAIMVAALVVLILTGSRTSTIATVAGLGIVTWYAVRAGDGRARIVFTIMLLLLGLLGVMYRGAIITNVALFLELDNSARGLGSGATGRVEAWKATWDLFLDNPLIGIGYRTSEAALGGAGGAHNGYLTTLVEIGLIGFLGVMVFLISGILRVRNQAGRGGVHNSYAILFAMATGYMLVAMFERYLINVGNPTSLFFLLAVTTRQVSKSTFRKGCEPLGSREKSRR